MKQPPWTVLLIGGHSGAGKSTLAAALTRRFAAGYTEVDDIRMALQRVTTPDQAPALHYFIASPGVAKASIWQREPEELWPGLQGVAQVVSSALDPVIAHHVATRRPLVLEGDGILPRLGLWPDETRSRTCGDAVCAIFLVEPNLDLMLDGAAPHGPDAATQARMHWRYGQWLGAEAERLDLAVIEPRPYDTLLERALRAIVR